MIDASALDPVVWLAIFIPLILLYIASIVDLIRRKDLSVVRKAGWVVVIVLTVYIGVALYYLFRPPATPEGKQRDDSEHHTATIVDQLDELRNAHARGDISDHRFLEGKRQVLGLVDQPSPTS